MAQEYEMKTPEGSPVKKGFDLKAFLIGMFCGVLIFGVVLFLIACVVFKQLTTGSFYGLNLFPAATEQVRRGVLEAERQKNITSVYGQILSIENNRLTVEAGGTTGVSDQYTFQLTPNTSIVRLMNDEASTRIPISAEELFVDAWVSVETAEPIEKEQTPPAVLIIYP
jgi:hypothetical protein